MNEYSTKTNKERCFKAVNRLKTIILTHESPNKIRRREREGKDPRGEVLKSTCTHNGALALTECPGGTD